MGPMIINRLSFFKEGNSYTNIEDFLTLDPRSYQRIPVNEMLQKVILPNTSLDVFAAELAPFEEEFQLENVRKELAPVTLRVHYRDIYDNQFTLERNLEWFSRYISDENSSGKK